MSELFKTVIILSLIGFFLIGLLLMTKPLILKRIPAKWQRVIYIAVMLSLILPVHKFIPENSAKQISDTYVNYNTNTEFYGTIQDISQMPVIKSQQRDNAEENLAQDRDISLFEVLGFIWILGMIVSLAVVLLSYAVYLARKKRRSAEIEDKHIFEEVKQSLKIRRKIRLKMAEEIQSPMLVGVIFPTVYIPCRKMTDENLKMVFLHELMHYKNMDLVIKWLAVFVGAIHWFNPLIYILRKNINEACEDFCDKEVTKNMSEEERKTYMKTILDLA